jgi:hypothetical protein
MEVEADIMSTQPITSQQSQQQWFKQHHERVLQELRGLGMSRYGFMHAEVRYLPRIVHAGEHLGGVVYGHTDQSFAMLVATDRRILFLDVKPMFLTEDEVTFDVISGITFGHVGPASTVTLHTKVRDYKLKTYNRRCAEGFIAFIESRCLEHRLGGIR